MYVPKCTYRIVSTEMYYIELMYLNVNTKMYVAKCTYPNIVYWINVPESQYSYERN